MIWFYLALLAALFQTAAETCCKQISRLSNENLTALSICASPLLFLGPMLLFSPAPDIDPRFWQTTMLVALFDALGVILLARAIHSCDLSLALPLQMTTPLVLLIASPFILGEVPSALGLAGILLIGVGVYCLNASSCKHGLLEPFRQLTKHKGARYMLGAASIWGILVAYHKICVLYANPLVYGFSNRLLTTVFVAVYLLYKKESLFAQLRTVVFLFILAGAFTAGIHLCTYSAMMHGLAIYVIAVKRASVLFGVLIGCYLFREFGLRERFGGAVLMTAGAFLCNF